MLQDWGNYGDDIANKLDRIAVGLTPAFVAAAHKLVGTGFDNNVRAVAAGAVRDLDSFEVVLDAALDELARLSQFHEREGKEQWRAIKDGECDEAEEEGYQEQHIDDGYAAGVFVSTYVKEVRSLGHWRILAEHPRISELGRARADILLTSVPASPEELRTVIAVTQLGDDENAAWEAVHQNWHTSLASDLEERILSIPEEDSLRAALVYCALMKTPETLSICLE